jgi:hypothetical protein
MSFPEYPSLVVNGRSVRVNVGAVDGKSRNIPPPLPGSVILHEHPLNDEFVKLKILVVVAQRLTPPPHSLDNPIPFSTLTFSNVTLAVDDVDNDENTLDTLADPVIDKIVDDFRENEPEEDVQLNRLPEVNCKFENEHVVIVIALPVDRTNPDFPLENVVRDVLVNAVFVIENVPPDTSTVVNDIVPSGPVNEQEPSVNDPLVDSTSTEIPSPSVIPKESEISVKTRFPPFVIPAVPLPPRLLVNDRVAFVDVELDRTLVFDRLNRVDVSPAVRISNTFPLSPFKCKYPYDAVLHLNCHVPQYASSTPLGSKYTLNPKYPTRKINKSTSSKYVVVSLPTSSFPELTIFRWNGNDDIFTIPFNSTHDRKISRPENAVFVLNKRVSRVNVGTVPGNVR